MIPGGERWVSEAAPGAGCEARPCGPTTAAKPSGCGIKKLFGERMRRPLRNRQTSCQKSRNTCRSQKEAEFNPHQHGHPGHSELGL